MAIDAYMYFMDYDGKYLQSESQVDASKATETFFTQFKFNDAFNAKGLFEVDDFSFDVEQTLNIGSQSSGNQLLDCFHGRHQYLAAQVSALFRGRELVLEMDARGAGFDHCLH